MRTFFVLLLAAIAISLAVSDVALSEDDLREFTAYKSTHGKTYDEAENARRIQIYKQNKDRIAAHNAKFAKGEVSYQMGINQFTDQLPEELPRGFRS